MPESVKRSEVLWLLLLDKAAAKYINISYKARKFEAASSLSVLALGFNADFVQEKGEQAVS